ncbi:MAG: alpha-2-macroglobulin [Pseudomonadota bacterium]|nr:alpha-2-macroglobulin [Pseudomonadota bacterium]
MRHHPRRTAAVVLGTLALAFGCHVAWRWYHLLPKPQFASFSVSAPARTRIEEENAKPDPLTVRFDRSVATLALAGKLLPTGVTIQPEILGTWRWWNDRVLEFRPKDDWPIGQAYTAALDKAILAPQIRIKEYGFKFSTASFSARVTSAQFYQDPVNPGLKMGVFDVQFTHPVDPAEFERRVEVRVAGQKEGLLGVGRETTPFTVVYDKLKLNASIHSASLAIPKDPTRLEVRINAGVRAIRGGNRTDSALIADAAVPGLYSLSVLGTEAVVVNNERNEPEQVLLVNLSAAAGERDVVQAVKAWILPKVRPAHDVVAAAGREDAPYQWYNAKEVTDAVLKEAAPLNLEQIPAEREYVESHTFRYRSDVGRFMFVQIEKNLRSFGGYLSPRTERFIVRVPRFPPELKILSQGSLLALSGDRKVAALVRDLPGIRIDVARVLPAQLQHLVSQSSGDFANPSFYGGFGPDNLTERFVRKIPLANLGRGQAHYETIDLGEYLRSEGAEKRGIFLLTVQGYDPRIEAEQQKAAAARQGAAHQPSAGTPVADEDTEATDPDDIPAFAPTSLTDKRLVLVTDLGIVMKRSTDGTQDVFVQSIVNGLPVPGASVEIVAINGTTLMTQLTDTLGRAHFLKLDGLTRERAPLLVQVKKGADLSFLPLNHSDRSLDMSRFDIGGVRSARNANQLTAYLFSDRGIYRPGDTFHIGMITKTADWAKDLAGIPLESEVLDARGLTVARERFKLPTSGFAELSYTTADTAPTGTYTVNLYIVKDNRPDGQIGTTTVRVQEFEPDRMKIMAHLSTESTEGWVSPKDLKALVNVQNLFGTPAEHRRVEATLTLTPAFPAFRALPDYRFYDPQRAKEGYTDKLRDADTDTEGNAAFDLGLQKYAKATYRVHLLARAFEPAAGRSVTADVATLVSELPFLVGFKADGDLGFLTRDSKHLVSWIAIDPHAEKTPAAGLTLRRVETKFISVLTRQNNGTYQYESKKKDITLSEEPFAIPAPGLDLALATDTPGTYAYLIRDAARLELNRVEYTVVGQANVARSLDRNAELQITLNKKDYAPGEEIELSIKAPYTGAGLITIERDHVYAAEWFKSTTTASVQKIRLPADFEGNGYVSVQFIRDPSSDEIFTSPLSYGVVPFATNLSARTDALMLQVPHLIKPGESLHIKLDSARPTRAVVFAVDEGILQVAHYQTPDPLGEFFKKRALEVKTSQILDLTLPEFKRILAAAAPGGDGEAALRRNLNPFKRKHDKPAVYWSGIVDVNANREFTWTVPDSFNGSLKVFALAVNDSSIGVAQTQTLVRGDFVLTPNMPVAVAPGDEFEVSVGVANSVAGSGADASVAVVADLPPQLEPLGPRQQMVKIGERREGVALFRFRARPQLGATAVKFTASWQEHESHLVADLSVRPASPYVTEIMAGYFASAVDVPIERQLYANYRKLSVGVSSLPLVLADSVADYLDDYPHLCTEQLVSRGFAALVVAHRPELARRESQKTHPPGAATAALLAVLRGRQNAEGAFGLWAASVDADEFASVYALHWLIDAHDRGEAIPGDLLQKGLVWLQRYAASPVPDDGSAGLQGLRNRAYATYLLTRQGMVTTPLVASLRETLDSRYAKVWKTDVTAAYLASVHRLQHQDREAATLIEGLATQIGTPSNQRFSFYYDDTVRDAEVLYLLSRHFPDRARALKPQSLQALVAPLGRGQYNTLSSAWLVLAFDAYATGAPLNGLDKFSGSEVAAGGKRTALDLKGQLILRGPYDSDGKQLHLVNDTGLTGYFAITNSGYDLSPPTGELRQGIEILREYLDAQGQPTTNVRSGEEITVRLRMRAIASDHIGNVAVTDLLPGGFEPVLQSSPATLGREDADASTPSAGSSFDRLGRSSTWHPEFADVREDRVVLYGTLSKNLAEYQYRIRATNAGSFLVPPTYAESMYDRTLRARAHASRITVQRPQQP